MPQTPLEPAPENLPPEIRAYLTDFIAAAREAFADLESVVLFGSGAEGRLRVTSDLNLMCVLKQLSPEGQDALRPILRQGHSLCRLRVLFILSSELAANAELFALKFSDIKRRHAVLFGPDPVAGLPVERRDLVLRLRQTLTNLKQRARAVYAWDGDNAARLTLSIADMAGPLRSAAAAILSLEGQEMSPKQALEKLAGDAGMPPGILENLSRAREAGSLNLAEARQTHQALGDLSSRMLERIQRESV